MVGGRAWSGRRYVWNVCGYRLVPLRRCAGSPWGYLIAAIASIQGALYLLVLSVNAAVAIQRGLATAAGELPVWGTLALFTAAMACLVLARVRSERTAF